MRKTRPNHCPRCNSLLNSTEIRRLWGQFTASLRKVRSGGRVWGKHNPNFKNCKCHDCNQWRRDHG